MRQNLIAFLRLRPSMAAIAGVSLLSMACNTTGGNPVSPSSSTGATAPTAFEASDGLRTEQGKPLDYAFIRMGGYSGECLVQSRGSNIAWKGVGQGVPGDTVRVVLVDLSPVPSGLSGPETTVKASGSFRTGAMKAPGSQFVGTKVCELWVNGVKVTNSVEFDNPFAAP